MPTWATVANVESRLHGATFTASTKPSLEDVNRWLDFAEARLRAGLAAKSIGTTHAAGSDAALMLGEAATDYAVGRVLARRASLEGDGENGAGDVEIERFDEFVNDIRTNSVVIGEELNGGDADSAAVRVRTHVTDTPGTVDADFDARVKMSEVID